LADAKNGFNVSQAESHPHYFANLFQDKKLKHFFPIRRIPVVDSRAYGYIELFGLLRSQMIGFCDQYSARVKKRRDMPVLAFAPDVVLGAGKPKTIVAFFGLINCHIKKLPCVLRLSIG
jgi:hypothetical protein